MTLADKRKVIEVLLCAGMEFSDHITSIAHALDCPQLTTSAQEQWWGVDPSPYRPGGLYDAGSLLRQYELDATEAAYRLIESSAVLRREWFGAR